MREIEGCYEAIYRITAHNRRKGGKRLSFSGRDFRFMLDHGTGEVDLSEWKDYDNKTFFKACYCGLLLRFPDERAKQKWRWKIRHLPRVRFQKKLLRVTLNSEEFKVKGVVFNNTVYPDLERGLMADLWKLKYRAAQAVKKNLLKRR